MKRNFLLFLAALLALAAMTSCGDSGGTSDTTATGTTSYDINGYVQKGPFINGSSITVYELGNDLIATGRTFNSQTKDNTGFFTLKGVALSSTYVMLRADGFYHNEVLGAASPTQLTLYAISDLNDKQTININLLSSLEKTRAEYLMEQGKTISEAKKQAQKEILNIFFISKDDINNSETLDISSAGDDNAILLAISAILQGYRTTSELSQLLANISSDIRTDGILDSSSLGTQLINDGKLLNQPNIRANLISRYNELGLPASIPNFEQYVNQFINNSTYLFDKYPEYPQNGAYGANILNESFTAATAGHSYSFVANLPLGTTLKIVVTSDGLWSSLLGSQRTNWVVALSEDRNTITATNSGGICEANCSFFSPGIYTVEYYENNSTAPTRTKQITVN